VVDYVYVLPNFTFSFFYSLEHFLKRPLNQSHLTLTTQACKQTSGDLSGLTWNYRGITFLSDFTTALICNMVSSVTKAVFKEGGGGYEINPPRNVNNFLVNKYCVNFVICAA